MYKLNLDNTQLFAGIILLVVGISLIFFPIKPIVYFTYPLSAWGVITIIDLISWILHKKSLIRSSIKPLLLTIIPVSVTFWLFFEFTNLVYKQWVYINVPHNIIEAILMTFFSFSTVIPLIIEGIWLLYPNIQNIIEAKENNTQNYLYLFPAFAIILILLYIKYPSFILAQTMWITPLIFLIPLIPFKTMIQDRRFIISVVIGSVISGTIWESINFWAYTKWKYLIFPHSLHLFAMPIFGYLGYIPFAFTTISLYIVLERYIKVNALRTILLYTIAIGISTIFITKYILA